MTGSHSTRVGTSIDGGPARTPGARTAARATRVAGTITTVIVLAMAFPGCAPMAAMPGDGAGAAPLQLTVQPQPARMGQEVVLTLTNRSNRDVGYNLCPTLLQRRVGDQWQASPVPFTEVCTMELRLLRPGENATFRHPLPSGIPAGTYRFWAAVEWGGERVGVQSAPFEVTG